MNPAGFPPNLAEVIKHGSVAKNRRIFEKINYIYMSLGMLLMPVPVSLIAKNLSSLFNVLIHAQGPSQSMISFISAPWELLLLVLANLFSGGTGMMLGPRSSMAFDSCYCLSWRVAVEANNAQAWRMVPARCVLYVENYMLAGQYNKDVDMVMEQISTYFNGMVAADDGMDAWVLDIDDTCLSNLLYYEGKRFGGDPWDPSTFKSWAQRGLCPAIPAVLLLYKRLINGGFKVFLLTGRDEEALGASTAKNLCAQGFVGYERLILRYVFF